MYIPVRALTASELSAKSSPASTQGGALESYRASFFDTETYPAAGIGELDFFVTTKADPTLSNMRTAGQFQDPDFFQLWALALDFILPVSADAAPTAWADMDNLVRTGRPIVTLNISDKNYGPWLATEMHGTGGATGFGYSDAGVVGVLDHEYANNGILGHSLWLDGSIIIPPKIGFRINIRWGNAQAVAADTLVRPVMQGVIARRIL